MKFGKIATGLGGLTALLLATSANGADLLSVYDQALLNDPQIREADATRRAQRESRPQAIANLLPDLSASANTTDSWNLSVTQPIFTWSDWMALGAANSQVAQAESNFLAARQSLAQRVAQQYFNVLNARDNLQSVELARDAIQRQLEQAEQRFEVGLIARTDVQDALAERDNANAQVIGAKRQVASAEEQLRATIGEKHTVLNGPAEDMPLVSPDPASEDTWVNAAMEQNATLISSRLAFDIARSNVRSSFGSFMPSVGLTLSKGHNDFIEQNSTSDSRSVSLGFSLNLNGGGLGNYSRSRQAQHNSIAARERLERTSRDTERQARDAYQGVISEIARVQALRQAVESSRTALEATEAGYDVGTRTAVDVLNSRRLLIQAETNYSAAKYAYLNNLVLLRLTAGDLDRSVIEELNRWLTVPTVIPPPAPAQ
jgi:outer membrane protein